MFRKAGVKCHGVGRSRHVMLWAALWARLFVRFVRVLDTGVKELGKTSSEGTSGDAAGCVRGLAEGPKRKVSNAL